MSRKGDSSTPSKPISEPVWWGISEFHTISPRFMVFRIWTTLLSIFGNVITHYKSIVPTRAVTGTPSTIGGGVGTSALLENVLAPVIHSATISDTSSTPSSYTGPLRSQKSPSLPHFGAPGTNIPFGLLLGEESDSFAKMGSITISHLVNRTPPPPFVP